jgi:hypothetical protein
MKKLLFFLWAVLLYSCNSQSQLVNKKTKKNMEYFNIEKYKDWEYDTDWFSDKTSKFLKKESNRVEISFYNSGIKVSLSNINTRYEKVKGFSNLTKGLIIESNNFYNFRIGKDIYYDENGRVTKEVDNDAPYKFSIDQLIKKIKKDYDVDIEKKTKTVHVRRWLSFELNHKPLYCVSYDLKDESQKWKFVLVDGNTGETLFTTLFYFGCNDNETLDPYSQYLVNLRKKEKEDHAN